MRTLDRFFEIEFSTYSDITSLCVSLYHVLKRKMLWYALVYLLCEFFFLIKASKMATRDLAQPKLRRFLATSTVTSEVLS